MMIPIAIKKNVFFCHLLKKVRKNQKIAIDFHAIY